MLAAKLPNWAQAIGSMLARQFDVSHEPLPLEMDLMLRLVSSERGGDDRVRKESRKLPGTAAALRDASRGKSKRG
jgi:hypothetical protein